MHRSALVFVGVVCLAAVGWSHEGEQHGAPMQGPAAVVKPSPAQSKPVSTVQLSAPQRKSLERTVKAFIRRATEDGAFIVHDDKLDQDLRLKLVQLQLDRASQLSERLYSVRGDFKEAGGKKGVAVDFLVNKSDEGWSVRQAVLRR